ncbi:MerR family DNA-binding transcriptional regulator [Faecalimicrobium sp. JNUCC 81]
MIIIFKIGEFSKISQISIRRLRYYNDINLVVLCLVYLM